MAGASSNAASTSATPANGFRYLASAALIGLIALCIAWEGLLAPLRPGGSWLILKALPLLIPLFGILRGKRYTYQWASMFVLVYFTEGAVRAWSDKDLSQTLAWIEVALTIVFFIAAILYARQTAPSRTLNRQPAGIPPAT